MATETKTYDPAAIVVTIGGKDLSGYEPGTFVTLVRNVNNYDWTVGPDGVEGIRTKRNDRSALLTFTLRQTAAANFILSNLANRDEQGGEGGNDGVVKISISDTSTPETIYVTGKGWIEKPADANFAETPQGRAWQIRLSTVPMVHGSTPATAALAEQIT